MYTLLRDCRERNRNETKRSLWNPYETMDALCARSIIYRYTAKFQKLDSMYHNI